MQGPLFDVLSERELAEVREHTRVLDSPPLETILRQGAADPVLLVLTEGRVEVIRDGYAIDSAGAGEVVGEMSLFTGRPRSATVRAIEHTRCLALDRDGYELLRDRGHRFAFELERHVLDLLSRRLRRIDERIVECVPGEVSPYVKPAPSLLDRVRRMFTAQAGAHVPTRPLDAHRVLERSALFAGERYPFVARIASSLRQESWSAGSFVCTQGEPGQAMYVIGRGQVDVVVALPAAEGPERIHRLATLGPGDAFGLGALQDGSPRIASCVTRSEVDLLVLDHARWQQYLVEASQVGSAMRRAAIRGFAGHLEAADVALLSALASPADPEVLIGARLDTVSHPGAPPRTSGV